MKRLLGACKPYSHPLQLVQLCAGENAFLCARYNLDGKHHRFVHPDLRLKIPRGIIFLHF
jgi:hypothetical protein